MTHSLSPSPPISEVKASRTGNPRNTYGAAPSRGGQHRTAAERFKVGIMGGPLAEREREREMQAMQHRWLTAKLVRGRAWRGGRWSDER